MAPTRNPGGTILLPLLLVASAASLSGRRAAAYSPSLAVGATTRLVRDAPRPFAAAARTSLARSRTLLPVVSSRPAVSTTVLGALPPPSVDAIVPPLSHLDWASGTLLLSLGSSDEAALAAAQLPGGGPLSTLINSILATSTFWSVAIMLSIVALLVSWEEFVHNLRKTVPPALFPVIDSMLAEMGGLGFIGLFLSVFVTSDPEHGLGAVIADWSERFLGEEEILLEAFEFLHSSFFEVGVGFFVVTGVIVASVLRRIQELSLVSELALDTDGDGEVSLDEMADALRVEALVVDADGDGILSAGEITDALRATAKRGIWEEMGMTVEKRGAEILLIRERLLEQRDLPDHFLVEEYFEQIFAHELEEIVELSPLTWLPLIPLISLLDSVDLSREVISASSSNAALSAGCFIDTSWFFVPSVLAQIVGLAWCTFNFWKMAIIKNMLVPTLVRDGGPNGPARILPPRYQDKKLRLLFRPSPGIVGPIERALGGTEATNLHERLFGAAGAAGPTMFRNSIKFHTWLCVAQIVFLFGQIVVRDAWALHEVNTNAGVQIGNLPGVLPELVLYSTFVGLSIGQLALAPAVFLNYCTVTSVEEMTRDWAVSKARKISEEVRAVELAEEEGSGREIHSAAA